MVALANLMPEDEEVDELDSYMYQTVGHQLVAAYAACTGLPLYRRRIRGVSKHQVRNGARRVNCGCQKHISDCV